MILLDTDIMVDVLRGYEQAKTWLESSRSEEIGLCGLVAMELIQGCPNADEQRRLEIALRPFPLF
jgi:predicted nucleic acid-binding protein